MLTLRIVARAIKPGHRTWVNDVCAQPKVVIGGILTAEFASSGQCYIFGEWWHSAENSAAMR